MKNIVDIFVELGDRLASLTTSEGEGIITAAIEQNAWFTRPDIVRAMEAIREEMLNADKLRAWYDSYPRTAAPKRVAIVMAGNIPLVGFFDLLCVLCSGNEAYVKPSSKDRVLMEYVIAELRAIDSTIPIYTYSAEEQYNIAIATGGDQANDYFRSHFEGTRRLLRGSRHSVALLDGNESEEELSSLITDITAYSGLGCRSISMLFMPRTMTLSLPHTAPANPKLRNNIAARRALYTLQQCPFSDYGAFIAVEQSGFPQSLAEVSIVRYDDISEAKVWIEAHREEVQCVVSHADVANTIPFGRAQYPTLWDYADGVDTMKFLSEEA